VDATEGNGKHVASALRYTQDVISGAIPACKWTKAACQRQVDDLAKWPARGDEYWFDAESAERVCTFLELLPHIKGQLAREKKRFTLEPWQCFLACVIFGWRRKDGTRRFRTAYTEVPRKNGKSFLLAGAALFMLALDGEAGAEVYSLATTRDQARMVFSTAKEMAKREPEFRAAFAVDVNAHSLTVEETASKFEALSADENTLDGLNISFATIDELHAHKTRGVWDVTETATGARPQPLIWAITTAGSNRAGICYEQRGYVCNILNSTLKAHGGMGYRVESDSVVDESYFGIIYTIDDEDDWTLEESWRKANPNYGISVNPEDLRRKCHKAMQLASAQPNFLTKHLDVWVNADAAWMDMLAWDRAADRTMTVDDFAGCPCYMGLDLASKVDIAAKVIVFKRDGAWNLFGRYYLPEDAIDESDNSQYRGWSADGYLVETPGNVVDYDAVETDFREWADKFKPSSIAFDPGFAWDFCQRMQNQGYPMVELRATVMNYSEPMKELEKLVLSGKLKHDGNPVLSWMISNVVCHRDAKDNIYPRKEREENKIDGAVATIAALAVGLRDAGPSVYEQRGVLTL
jgi:phage terminase large subunit-like protein